MINTRFSFLHAVGLYFQLTVKSISEIFFILKKEKDQNLGWLMNSVEVSYMWNCPSVLLISTEVASSLIFFLGYNGDKIFLYYLYVNNKIVI